MPGRFRASIGHPKNALVDVTRAALSPSPKDIALTTGSPPAPSTILPLTNLPGGPPWPHGVGQISMSGGGAGYNSWKTWIGHDLDVMTVWVSPCASWTAFETGQGDTPTYLRNAMTYVPVTTPIVFSYPMVPNSITNKNLVNPGMWDQFAAGDFDNHYTVMAQNFKAIAQSFGRNPANHILRLGWEMNGDWYAWSIGNKVAQFKTSWERAIARVKAVIPGIGVDFSVGRPFVKGSSPRASLEAFLPAASSFDTISISHHDANPFTTSAENFTSAWYNPSPTTFFIGLVDLVNAATSRNKKIALTEWAPQMANCSADFPQSPNPDLFLQFTYDFLWKNRALVAWDTHFSVGCTSLYNRTGTQAAIVYKTLWNSGAVRSGTIFP